MLCAVISPLVGVGVVWALCVKRWRYVGGPAVMTGSMLAAILIAAYFVLNALLGEALSIQPLSIAIAGGAGFTSGALGAWAGIWMRGRSQKPTDSDQLYK